MLLRVKRTQDAALKTILHQQIEPSGGEAHLTYVLLHGGRASSVPYDLPRWYKWVITQR